MIIHNIIIAVRNLLKHKTQNLISILGPLFDKFQSFVKETEEGIVYRRKIFGMRQYLAVRNSSARGLEARQNVG